MNLSAFFYGAACLLRPSLLRPSLVVEDFSEIPTDIARALTVRRNRLSRNDNEGKPVVIKALIIDKDNCISLPHGDDLWPDYQKKWQELRSAFPGASVLIVSNTAGSSGDPKGTEARLLSGNLSADVLIHDTKKPGCYSQVFRHLKDKNLDIDNPNQLVVIGDRLFTDVVMANLIGSHSIWLKTGTRPDFGLLSQLEKAVYKYIL